MALLQVKSALKRYLPGITHMQSDAWIREVRTKGTFIQLIVLYTVSSIIFSNLFQPHHHTLHRRIVIPLPLRSSLLTPREVHHRKGEERIRRVRQTSQHIIPRDESRDDTKSAASHGQSVMRVSIGRVAGIEIRDSEADEGDPDHEEQRAKSQCRSDSQDP
jgi:hypothetical protein